MKDKFGRPAESVNFGREEFTAVEWDDTTTAGVIYLRGDYAESCVIQRVDTTNRRITWAYGKWTQRSSLQYGTDSLVRREA